MTRRQLGITLIATLLLSACALPSASPPEASRIDRFEKEIDESRIRLGIPGLSAVIVKDQEVSWAKGFGFADLENRIPAKPDTIYHIASITKTFAATLVMQLVEQRKLDLDEPASRYSNDFKDDSVKVKHLLSHTSKEPPGDDFEYDGERFEYLTGVIEKKAGKPFREVMLETFVRPLGMSSTFTSPDEVAVRSRLAQPYTRYGDEAVRTGAPPKFFGASAGLLSTVLDLAKYDAAIDRHMFLQRATQDRAWTPFVSNGGRRLPYGFGWFVEDYDGLELIWHYGHWGTGFSALYIKVPRKGLSVIFLANSEALADHQFAPGKNPWTLRTNAFACSFIRLMAQGGAHSACEEDSLVAAVKWIERRRANARVAVPVDARILEAYVGQYRFREFPRTITVTREGARLFVDIPRDFKSELFAESERKFFLKTRPMQLTFVEQQGKVTHIDFVQEGQPFRADKLPAP